MSVQAARQCVRGHPYVGDGLFCQQCGAFGLDAEGTVQMAARGERILSWLLNIILFVVTLGIGWIIWWFIVAPRGQNPGKAVTGLRVIRANGDAVTTGGMFVRGLVGIAFELVSGIASLVDDLWMLWDKNAQTLHDKVVNSVVVKANGSEKIVESGGVGALPAGVTPPPPYAPPVSFPASPPPTPQPPGTSPPTRQADEIYCHSCGQAVKAGSQFCPHCGASIAG